MKAVCIAAPMTAEKKAFRTLEAVVILQNNGFEADGWRPLLLNIRSKQATV
jgi:hypothetical protein